MYHQKFSCCNTHLDDEDLLLRVLLPGLRFYNRPYRFIGQKMQLFLLTLRDIAASNDEKYYENNFSDNELKCLTSLTREQFQDLFTFCDLVPVKNGYQYINKKDLLIFLCKLRQGLSDIISHTHISR